MCQRWVTGQLTDGSKMNHVGFTSYVIDGSYISYTRVKHCYIWVSDESRSGL